MGKTAGMELGRRPQRSWQRILLVLAGGFLLGALLTEVAALVLPESAARQFFVTTVSASVGPVAMDLLVVAITLGPVALRVNVLSVVGVVLVAWFGRSLL